MSVLKCSNCRQVSFSLQWSKPKSSQNSECPAGQRGPKQTQVSSTSLSMCDLAGGGGWDAFLSWAQTFDSPMGADSRRRRSAILHAISALIQHYNHHGREAGFSGG